MNDLNSVLLEGRIVGSAVRKVRPGEPSEIEFSLRTVRVKVTPKKRITCQSVFPIVCYGKLAESLSGELGNGRGVRVVGRIANRIIVEDKYGINYPQAYIEAEHVELRIKA